MIGLVKDKSGPGHVRLKDVPEPSAGPGQVKTRVEAAGVCGSDLHILHHDVRLNLRPPVVMGHEFCGVVAEIGEGVTEIQCGERVSSETTFRSCSRCRHCLSGNYHLCPGKELIGYVHDGCFASYCVVPAERIHRLPENVSFEEGALCEPLACCCHAVLEQTQIHPPDVVVVAGVGAIGLLCSQVAQAIGARVIICGTNADHARFKVAEALGVEKTINVANEDAEAEVKSLTGGEGADVFMECSGAPAAASMGISLLRRGGRFCQVGLFGKPLEFDLEQVAYKELAVTGSIGSKRSSWLKALDLLSSGKLNLQLLTSRPLPLARWKEAFRRFETKEGLKVLLRP